MAWRSMLLPGFQDPYKSVLLHALVAAAADRILLHINFHTTQHAKRCHCQY
jgi:hypothetical protein